LIDEGSYDENTAVRSMAVAQKFNVVTIVLKNHSDIHLNISLSGKLHEQIIEVYSMRDY
jgi:hypothetical protein